MTEQTADKNNKREEVVQPDSEKLQTADPQEEMNGPVSSIVQHIKEATKDDITKKEADEIKDKNL